MKQQQIHRQRMHFKLLMIALMAWVASGCLGNGASPLLGGGELVNDTSEQLGGELRQVTDSIPQSSPCTSDAPAERMIRRLSNQQITKTLQMVWQRQDVPAVTFLSNRLLLGLENHADLSLIQDASAQQINTYAESFATWAADKWQVLDLPCRDKNQACAQQVIEHLNKTLLRNSLDPTRISAYVDFFLAQNSFADGIKSVLETMVQSPYFLYRTEIGDDVVAVGEQVNLTPYEVASLLSFFLTDHGPDKQLLQSAESGAILETGERLRQAKRLIEDPTNQSHIVSFFQKWLNTGNLSEINRQDPQNLLPLSVKQALTTESQRLIHHVLFTEKQDLAKLLTADYSILSDEAARYYGGTSMGASIPTPLPTNREAGLLGQASWLITNADAGNSSPTLRGKIIRTRLLCQNLPPPPPNVAAITDTTAGFRTTRERFELHVKDPACASCHRLMDPMGVTFEYYDHLGRFRADEGGAPIDPNGMIYNLRQDVNIPVRSVEQLMTRITEDQQTDYCMIRFWSYQAFGLFSWQQDACTHQAIEKHGQQQQSSLYGILEGIVASPSFTRRIVQP